MTVHAAVAAAMARWPEAIEDGTRVLVSTHCLYPSHGVVTVIVEGGENSFSVHDDGGALDELDAASGVVSNPLAIVRSATRRHGVRISDRGIIYSPLTDADGLTAAITVVANASKDAAQRLIDSMRPRPRRNFPKMPMKGMPMKGKPMKGC